MTVDNPPLGRPSWIRICFGAPDAEHQLVFVAAGNTPLDLRHQYPDANYTDGIHDPGQAWNAVTVGATLAGIESPDYLGWRPVAPLGALSPSSTTSLIWDDMWPHKPDVVMEGGNSAINPATGHADMIEDLSLLTTSRYTTGRLFVATGDTKRGDSPRRANGRHHPVRIPGVLGGDSKGPDHPFGRVDGSDGARVPSIEAGLPETAPLLWLWVDLGRALWCGGNALTLVAQEEIQPFDKEGSDVKSRDMHLYPLPWPVDQLRDLGATPVTMRVTLSYFVSPAQAAEGGQTATAMPRTGSASTSSGRLSRSMTSASD